RPDRARDGFWTTVSELLIDAQAGLTGPRGRYWLSRSLLEYARLQESEGKPGEARKAYTLILDSNLPGQSLAETNLARLRAQLLSQ
ncbi:MAG: hypothetical protein JJU25_09515, partial [Halomonas sp.]